MKLILKRVLSPVYYAQNMRDFLKNIGISQADLARKFKISRGYMCDIARGRRPVPDKILSFLENQMGGLDLK